MRGIEITNIDQNTLNIIKVMVVEDEYIIALDLKDRLSRLGYIVPTIATSGKEAVQLARKDKPDLILMDIMLRGEIDGVQAAKSIREKDDVPVLFVSSFSDINSVKRAQKVSPYGYLVKPFTETELKTGVEEAFKKHQRKRVKKYKDNIKVVQ
jgi:CheY-like chemotaxis protein